MLKTHIYKVLESESEKGPGQIVDWALIGLISLNVLAVVLETVHEISERHGALLHTIENVSILIFTLEYFLRLWVCTASPRFHNPLSGRLRFAATPAMLIDLLVILPFYLPLFLPVDLRMLRAVRLLRLFSLFKLTRYSESLNLLGDVFRKKREELLVVAFSVLILLVIASSLMYYAERGAQPEAFSSIPEAMWWGVATLTTVGYGDICPITPLGKFIASIIALLGVGLVALPAGILSSSFIEHMQEKKHGVFCQLCSERIKKGDDAPEGAVIP